VDGGKQALERVARAHLSPGDLVALTVPTVLTAIGILRREGATLLPPNRSGRAEAETAGG
jgi:DNA-binding transcriptional MocR family regulator